jgi:hypothetical protein
MENNIENDIDYTIKIMETHILNLKKKLDEERSEHRDIYLQLKKEIKMLKEENDILKKQTINIYSD